MAGGDDPFFLKFWVNGALVNGPRWSDFAPTGAAPLERNRRFSTDIRT